MSDFKITDEHITAALKYLQIFHPEVATPEYAENWLLFWKAKYREIALGNLDNDTMEKLFDEFQQSKG